MTDLFDAPAVVLDNGSSLVKAGFAGDEDPYLVYPSIVGYPKHKDVKATICAGNDAIKRRSELVLKWPVEHGIVTDWDGMTELWHQTFKQLDVLPEERLLLLTEPALNPKRNREKMYEIMFEEFDVPAMYVAIQAVLSLYATGRMTGTVLDSGGGVTHSVPVIEGYIPANKATRMNLGGRDITEYLARLLRERNYQLYTNAHMDIVTAVKEALGYVAIDYEAELADADTGAIPDLEQEYELPDGQVIAVGSERFRCAEVLFQPQLVGIEARESVHSTLLEVIQKCDMDTHKELYGSIVLSGGSTMFRGMAKRVEAEMRARVPTMMMGKVRVVAPDERKYAVWVGGSVMASLGTFPEICVDRSEYNECGPSIVHQRL